jgi:phosphatidylserine/phosphatidylglycerophosphate/cardiolipin synthase-like enzyme
MEKNMVYDDLKQGAFNYGKDWWKRWKLNTRAIIKELEKAKATILVQAYSFTSAPIAKALMNVYKGGKVEVILDKSQTTERYSPATFLYNAGIPTKIDAQQAIAHNKVMVFDGEGRPW